MRLFAFVVAASAAAVSAAPPSRPLVPLHDAASVTRVCEQGLAAARRTIARMEATKGAGTIFAEWNRLQIAMEDFLNPIYLLGNVHPDKAVRDAAEPCLQKYTTLSTQLLQSEKLFARIQAARPVNAHQKKLRKDLVESFEDSGVALARDKRERAKAIFDRIEELRQAYERNVRDDPTTVAFTEAQMQGVPETYLRARKRDDQGRFVLGLDYPSYIPFVTNAKDGEARRRYYVAKLSEGGAKNVEILDEMFRLRQELAALYDLPSFAHYTLRRRMVERPEVVEKFLAEVKDAVAALEESELEELRAEKARETGRPLAGTKLERWDLRYYQERVRRARFSVDQEKLRKYFPTPRAVEFTFLVSSRLFGVRFREAKVPAWHPDVRYFDVLDAKTGRYIGGIYLDLFPREGKYSHAAAFPVRGASRLARRTPLSALVTNFNRNGLDHEELETLLHEFGHVLHGVLSRADYNSHAGTAVVQDFVEAPSQMLQEWARREPALALFRTVCPECPQLTSEEIRRLDAARRYGQGYRYASQWLYAVFDMKLSTDPQPALALWKNLESATALGHVEGTMFPASFDHIASNYASGYYGYMWSEVLALDMLSAFAHDMLDPKVGARFRDAILSQGGQVEAMDMVRGFLGREPSNEAFFAEITGKR